MPVSDLRDIAATAKLTAKLATRSKSEDGEEAALGAEFQQLVGEAEPLILEETGFHVPSPARARVLTRGEWAAENVDSMLTLLAPLVRRVDKRMSYMPVSGLVRIAYRPAIGAQLGAVLGFLSQRVLGQYDTLRDNGDQVWFVGENMLAIQRRFDFVPRDFRLWVVLHELTHRSQFEGNPWVRPYFLEGIETMMNSLDVDAGGFLRRSLSAARDPDAAAPLGVRLLDPDQRKAFNRMQAFMTVVEGHGNFVMDRIAERIIPTQPRMREVLRSGAAAGGFFARMLGKLLGLEMKRAQYEQGQAFFNEVHAADPSLVGYCFSAPEALPTLEEIRSPSRWIQRSRV